MTNEVTTPRGAAVLADIEGFDGFAEAVKTAKADRAVVAGGGPALLRMGTDGIWLYGAENVEVEKGSVWVLDPRSIVRGFVCWTRWSREQLRAGKRNKLLGEVYVPMNGQRPDESQLPTHMNEDTGEAWPWADAMAAKLICQSGQDRGLEVLYKVSSVGGLRLLNDIVDQIDANLATGKIVPSFTLENDHYDHRDYGKTYTPVFADIEWSIPEPGCGLPDLGLMDGSGSGDAEIEDQTEDEVEEAEEVEEKDPPKRRGRQRPAV